MPTRVFVQTKKSKRAAAIQLSCSHDDEMRSASVRSCFGADALAARSYVAERSRQRRPSSLKGQGLKPQHIARREIVTMAKDYLAAHPELIAEAKPIGARRGSLERRLRVRLVTF